MSTPESTSLISEEAAALVRRIERVLNRIEAALPPPPPQTDWSANVFRWRKPGRLVAVAHPTIAKSDDLLHIDTQSEKLELNTRQFLARLPANNALLWGPRGTGKSTLIRALLTRYAPKGLRLIEVERADLTDLPEIADAVRDRSERFIIFADDLSFEASDASYKTLKALLDGSAASNADNLLVYATSNRRHLMPEFMQENLEARNLGGEIHHSETVEEKISLSERFGLWISFYPFTQDQYLQIVKHWLEQFPKLPAEDDWRNEALRFALERGSRSGRVAAQFARAYGGALQLKASEKS